MLPTHQSLSSHAGDQDLLPQLPSAHVHVTLIVFSIGPEVQEQRCWQLEFAKLREAAKCFAKVKRDAYAQEKTRSI